MIKISAIKKIREQKGITQNRLAKAIGVTPGAISQWETGRTNPKAKILMRIAKALECTVEELLEEA